VCVWFYSTGVPHVLEHSVLCGSRKFPVKEPFVELLKGSLQNFLNAFTYPDRTCYPVASTNTKDFYNLVHVYMDAVLHPKAVSDPQVLQQEGWHYELDGDDAQAGALSIKGVVYNEMKGVYSSPDALMGRATQRALFPDNAYAVDSGGDPADIPKLSFEQFRAFHAQYYHPANSRIFFYGNDDPLTRLNVLDEYLREFDAIAVKSEVAFQKKWELGGGAREPKKIQVAYPISAGTEPKHMISLNWLLNDEVLSAKEVLALGVLDHLLLGTSSAPLHKALTESDLGESLIGGGLSDELVQATFSTGLKGVLPDDVAKVQALVQDTLRRLSVEGFDAAAVQASINTMEFRLRKSITLLVTMSYYFLPKLIVYLNFFSAFNILQESSTQEVFPRACQSC
jgi:presequence protease